MDHITVTEFEHVNDRALTLSQGNDSLKDACIMRDHDGHVQHQLETEHGYRLHTANGFKLHGMVV